MHAVQAMGSTFDGPRDARPPTRTALRAATSAERAPSNPSTASPSRYFVERTGCPACGSIRSVTRYRADYTFPPLFDHLRRFYRRAGEDLSKLRGAQYQLEACADCTLVYQKQIPAPDLLVSIYDAWMEASPDDDRDLAQRLENPAVCRDGQELLALQRYRGIPAESMAVLDFGMGFGAWCRVAKALGFETYGYELSSQRDAFAAQHGFRAVRREEIPGLALDFINTEQVFEHLCHPMEEARLLAASLKPGGILKVSVPRAIGLGARLLAMDWSAPRWSPLSLAAVRPLEHLQCYTRRALEQMLGSLGLYPIRLSARCHVEFLRHGAATNPRLLPSVGKQLVRPLYNRLSWNNQYYLFEKPA